nr:peptidoglycan binding domain-containing protein [Actinomycetota bacterium]
PEDVVVDAERLGAELDAAKTARRAYAVGRSGGLLERVGDRARAAFGGARVEAAVDYRPGAVRAAVENIADRVNREPRAASVVIREAEEAEVVRSENGYELDVVATAQNVRRAVEDLGGEARMAGEVLAPEVSTPEAEEAAEKARRAMSGTVVLTSGAGRWELSPAGIGRSLGFVPEDGGLRVVLERERLKANLADLYAALTVEPVEAGYRVDDAASHGGECPYATHSSSGGYAAGFAAGCVGAGVAASAVVLLGFAAARTRRADEAGSRPAQLYLSPESPPPRLY